MAILGASSGKVPSAVGLVDFGIFKEKANGNGSAVCRLNQLETSQQI